MKKDLTIEDLALSLEEAGELIIPQNVEATWKKRLPVPFSLSLNKVWNRYVIGENYDGSIEYIGDPIVVRTKANSDGQIIRPIIITTESHRSVSYTHLTLPTSG